VRFPFTFMGVMALGIGVFAAFYLVAHSGMDPLSEGIVALTAVLSFGFGVYVLIWRIRRGLQH
jgi:hypothetical protein